MCAADKWLVLGSTATNMWALGLLDWGTALDPHMTCPVFASCVGREKTMAPLHCGAALVLLLANAADALVLGGASTHLQNARSSRTAAPASPQQAWSRTAAAGLIIMQVDAPVKIPDKAPNLAPAKPSQDKQNEKGKKYKLLLFNDNVNR